MFEGGSRQRLLVPQGPGNMRPSNIRPDVSSPCNTGSDLVRLSSLIWLHFLALEIVKC